MKKSMLEIKDVRLKVHSIQPLKTQQYLLKINFAFTYTMWLECYVKIYYIQKHKQKSYLSYKKLSM